MGYSATKTRIAAVESRREKYARILRMAILTRLSLGFFGWVALILSSTLACSGRTMRTVAFAGEIADSDGGEPLSFAQFGTATINQDGEVALLARAQKTDLTTADGVWSEGGVGCTSQLLPIVGEASFNCLRARQRLHAAVRDLL
jgi:hypothetical protein